MLEITLFQLMYGFVFLGIGQYFTQKMQPICHDNTATNFTTTLLIGMGFSGAFGILINFISPVTTVFCLILIVSGLAGSYLFFRRMERRTGLKLALHFGAVTCLFSGITLHRGVHYDTGLYHLPSLVWAKSHMMPLGVANLQSQYGFNSLYTLIAALVYWPHAHQASFILNTLILSVFFFLLTATMLSNKRPESLFAGFLTIFLFWPYPHYLFDNLRSLATDLPSQVFGAATVLLLLQSERVNDERYVAALSLSFFAVLIKLSMAPIALCTLIYGFIFNRKSFLSHNKSFRILIAVCLVWIVRSLGLSGCVAFPIAKSCFNSLPWMPERTYIEDAARWIESWAKDNARGPNQVLADWAWLWPWFKGHLQLLEISWLIALCIMIYKLIFNFKDCMGCIIPFRRIAFWIATVFFNALFWFYSAPDIRFAAFSLAAFPSLIATLLLVRDTRMQLRLSQRDVVVICLPIILACFKESYLSDWNVPIRRGTGVDHPPLHSMTISNFNVSYPSVGDQCWNADVLCTPYPNKNIGIKTGLGGRIILTRPENIGP
jgi:hypothetical protein